MCIFWSPNEENSDIGRTYNKVLLDPIFARLMIFPDKQLLFIDLDIGITQRSSKIYIQLRKGKIQPNDIIHSIFAIP